MNKTFRGDLLVRPMLVIIARHSPPLYVISTPVCPPPPCINEQLHYRFFPTSN